VLLRPKLSTVCRTIGLSCLIFLFGCASNNDLTSGWTVQKLYQEAKDEMSAGAYDKAIGYYEKLEGRAAGTPLAQQAQLDSLGAIQNQRTYSSHRHARSIHQTAPCQPCVGLCLVLERVGQFQ